MKYILMLMIFFYKMQAPCELITLSVPHKTEIPKIFNLAVWNIYKSKKEQFESDYLTLSQDKEIVLLQEMYLSDEMNLFFNNNESLGYQMAVSFRMPFSNIATGVATGSTVTPFKIIPIKSEVSEFGLFTPKAALVTRYNIEASSKKLTVVNIHAINFVSAKTLKKQLMQIKSFIEKIDGPMIFAGDFNSWTDKKTNIMNDVMKSLGLNEVTFSVDHRIKFNGHILDHIFYRGMKLIESSARSEDEFEGSDHRPMVASFEILDI